MIDRAERTIDTAPRRHPRRYVIPRRRFVPWRDLWVVLHRLRIASLAPLPSPPRCCRTRGGDSFAKEDHLWGVFYSRIAFEGSGWLPRASGRGAATVGFSTYASARLGSSRRELSPIALGLPRCVPIGLVVFNSSIL